MRVDVFDFDLPRKQIADRPARTRDSAGLLVVTDHLRDAHVRDLPSYLRPGDLIIVNDTKVMKARLNVQLSNGSLVELLILELVNDTVWLCLGKPAKKLNPP